MKRKINGKTVIIGIIGENIKNSLSPFIHNQIISKYDLNFCYLPFQVKERNLYEAIQGIKALNLRGVNVTFPYKINVIQFLDKVEKTAQRIGAVNTIINDDGVLTGYNTDVIGFKRSLQEEQKEIIKGNKATILGAGGAARAVVYALLEGGIEEINIFNRTIEKAKEIKHRLSSFFIQSQINVFPLEKEFLKDKISKAHLLVNTTSIDMSSLQAEDNSLLDEALFHSKLLVNDLIYQPAKTLFLKQAEMAGAKTMNGLPMLVYQGIESFSLWTGFKPEKKEIFNLMRRLRSIA